MKKINLFSDVIKVIPSLYEDDRGYFSEDYNKKDFLKLNIKDNFLQDNVSFSMYKNTIRGLHFQKNPFAQCKLIKVVSGSIFDVFLEGSPERRVARVAQKVIFGVTFDAFCNPAGHANKKTFRVGGVSKFTLWEGPLALIFR